MPFEPTCSYKNSFKCHTKHIMTPFMLNNSKFSYDLSQKSRKWINFVWTQHDLRLHIWQNLL